MKNEQLPADQRTKINDAMSYQGGNILHIYNNKYNTCLHFYCLQKT